MAKHKRETDMKEHDLALSVCNLLREWGYTVYSEIQGYGTPARHDIVGLKNDTELIVVELKMSLNDKVIRQAYSGQNFTSECYVAIPVSPRVSSIERCRKYGVGIIQVSGDNAKILTKPTCKMEGWIPAIKLIIDRLKRHEPSDDAGKPNEAGIGITHILVNKVKEYLTKHPKATWKEIWENIENHYSSPATFCSSMKTYRKFDKTQFVKELI